jgi:glycosyltransferase involved in cell wall biosynthesis
MSVTNSEAPTLSIGLPVYNDDRFLSQTLDCLLSQSYRDFELIICDNASTDKTAEICRSYAGRDSRIRYHRNETNLGVSRNFNLSFHLSRGKYFKWAAANDLCAADMIERCVEVLDQRPDAVLCFAKTCIIDERGEIGADFQDRLNLQSDEPSERFRLLLEGVSMVNVTYGVSRSSALRLTRLEKPYPNSDVVLLAELALHGKFVEVSDTSFFRRMFEITTDKYPSAYDRMIVYEPAKPNMFSFPYWWLLMDFLVAIWRAPISMSERLHCFFHMHIWMQRWSRGLLQDLAAAAKRLMSRTPIKPAAMIGTRRGRE